MSFLRTNYRLSGSRIELEGPSILGPSTSAWLWLKETGYMWMSGGSLFVLMGVAVGGDLTYAVFHGTQSASVADL